MEQSILEKNELQNIPIPENEHDFKRFVKQIINVKSVSYLNDTSVLEENINQLVYHLYGLTYDEVLIVDPETPITREEYESNQQ